MVKIKNQRSRSKDIFTKIQQILSAHKAQKIMFEYNQSGRVDGMAFVLNINGQELMAKLPARVQNLAVLLYSKALDQCSENEVQQCYQTAWANIRDWIDAQLALVDTQMVQIGEVFLPYFVRRDGLTHFEHVLQNPQLLLN